MVAIFSPKGCEDGSLSLQLDHDTAENSGLNPEIDNLNVKRFEGLIPPSVLFHNVPLTQSSHDTVVRSREAIAKILAGEDRRLVLIIGPCSIHDFKSALEYAQRLQVVRTKYSDALEIVMRVYFEKPRTTVGWKGLVNDPDLNGENNVNKGLLLGRSLLSQITSMGVPTACEFLESFTPQYIGDLVSYGAIGARTTPCQLHQKLTSGLSMPVGIKNCTDGRIDTAVDACVVASQPQSFLGITRNGIPAYIKTKGNSQGHVILRGGSDGTNYSLKDIIETSVLMERASLKPNIVVDTSHANSQKNHKNQLKVVEDICRSMQTHQANHLVGLMIESHINEGNQSLDAAMKTRQQKRSGDSSHTMSDAGEPIEAHNKALVTSFTQDASVVEHLKYGVSITDACISWEDTEGVLEALAKTVRATRFSSQ